MGVIKGVLKEELINSVKMLNNFRNALKGYPGGSFMQKQIKGHKYYYLARRMGNKVEFIYKGKKLSRRDKLKLDNEKRLREKYKKQIQKLKVQIRYLQKVLKGKEDA